MLPALLSCASNLSCIRRFFSGFCLLAVMVNGEYKTSLSPEEHAARHCCSISRSLGRARAHLSSSYASIALPCLCAQVYVRCRGGTVLGCLPVPCWQICRCLAPEIRGRRRITGCGSAVGSAEFRLSP